eukprot:GILK01006427.1.p1 GENE.GILK01006427.1~~GILK01006427.1.p1  ORF type:complete len:218 (+),score=37.50 GILK01006427.1:32-655(+)
MPENIRTRANSIEIPAAAHSGNATPRDIDASSALPSDKFPSLDVLAKEKNIDATSNKKISELGIQDIGCVSPPGDNSLPARKGPSAWQGQLPEAVKQDGEFKKADINFVDEPAERAAGLAKYKQERKERREAKKEAGPLGNNVVSKAVVGTASSILGAGQSVVNGFLHLVGLRKDEDKSPKSDKEEPKKEKSDDEKEKKESAPQESK